MRPSAEHSWFSPFDDNGAWRPVSSLAQGLGLPDRALDIRGQKPDLPPTGSRGMAMKSPLAVIAYRGVPTIYERIPDGRGGSVLRAHELGRTEALELTSELLMAIEADERRQRSKQRRALDGDSE
jgi:hypothetical protein